MKSTKSNHSYKSVVHSIVMSLNSWLMLFSERYTGWTIGRFFSVKYVSGKESGRRYYPIANKRLGFVQSKEDGCTIFYQNFYGLTDPISIILLLFGNFGVIKLYTILQAVQLQVPNITIMKYSTIITVIVSIFTFLCSWLSSEGHRCQKELDDFFKRIL